MQVPQAIVPINFATRLRKHKLGASRDLALDGGEVTIELDPVGYGYGCLVHVFGNLVVSTATLVVKGSGIFDYIKRIILDPPGQANLISCSGAGLHMDNLFANDFLVGRQSLIEPRAFSILDTNAWADSNLVNAFLLTVGTNPIHLWYWVPMTRNADDLRGLRELGHGGNRTLLRLTPSTEADFVTVPGNCDASGIDVEVFQFYFDKPPSAIPGLGAVRLPEASESNYAIAIEEVVKTISQVGDHEIDVDSEGVILNATTQIVLNDAPNTADVTHMTLDLDRRRPHDGEPTNLFLKDAQQFYEGKIPVGVFPFDMDRYQSSPMDYGRGRRWLFSDEVNDVTIMPTIAAGATLGTVARSKTIVRRLVQLPG
jgi:hypothetical protein